MEKKVLTVEKLMKQKRQKRILKIVGGLLACVVVFCTSYALILPAITMEGDTYCGLEEHKHVEECYERKLICGYTDEVTAPDSGNISGDAGNQGNGDTSEGDGTVAEAHTHTDDCYETVTETKLTCGQEESGSEGHTHDDSCYTETEELTCGENESEGHTHDDSCYTETEELVCGEEESDDHTHTDDCYRKEKELTCGENESEGHTHDSGCYETVRELTCGRDEGDGSDSGHTHTDDCYEEIETQKLTCGKEESSGETEYIEGTQDSADLGANGETAASSGHVHTDECYEEVLVCGFEEEHTHELICYSNPEADVETADVWESTLPGSRSGDWAKDLIAVADSQVGYKESIKNYDVTDDNEIKGYSRYGAWYGDPYADWDALFVSFCLYYADVPAEEFPRSADSGSWVYQLGDEGLFKYAGEYTPVAGDLVFFGEDGTADHVGIIKEVNSDNNKLTVIEQNSEKEVARVPHSMDSGNVIGYGRLSEEPEVEEDITDDVDDELENEDWLYLLPGNRTGDWAKDLIAIADSQVGYTLSLKKVKADDAEVAEEKYYNRYGALYDAPYDERPSWFVVFCMDYAGILGEVPCSEDCSEWVEMLEEDELFISAGTEDFLPVAGDLVFFGTNKTADSVGIVKKVDSEGKEITVIEQNEEKQIAYGAYSVDEKNIIGYGLLLQDGLRADEIETNGITVLTENKVVESAWVQYIGSIWDIIRPRSNQGIMKRSAMYRTMALSTGDGEVEGTDASTSVGDIGNFLTKAQILIGDDKEIYDGKSPLDPDKDFKINLEWLLSGDDLDTTLKYEYEFPKEIHIDNVGNETTQYALYSKSIGADGNPIQLGTYYIKDGKLIVTYSQAMDEMTTDFVLNVSWDENIDLTKTEIVWGNGIKTEVQFDTSELSVTKRKIEDLEDTADGGIKGVYKVDVKARGPVTDVKLTDTLTPDDATITIDGKTYETFHFEYFEENGKKYSYRYKKNGDASYTYGGEQIDASETLSNTKIIKLPDMNTGEIYTIEYAVQLDGDVRMALDEKMLETGLSNTAQVTGKSGDKSISTSVTVRDSYKADDKWIIKEKGELKEEDVKNDPIIPWSLEVNKARSYVMSGVQVKDQIGTEGVVYITDNDADYPLVIDAVTKSGETTTTKAKWIVVEDLNTVYAALEKVDFDNDTDEELTIGGQKFKKSELYNYVFVNKSKSEFVWVSPYATEATSYKLSYYTDASKAAPGVLKNSASAGWKNRVVGDIKGEIFQQDVVLKKTNDGVYEKDGKYFVDWEIKLMIPSGSSAIEDVFLYDVLPIYDLGSEKVSDWLVIKNENGEVVTEIDFNTAIGAKGLEYLNEFTKGAFAISIDNGYSLDAGRRTSYGHPLVGMANGEYAVYQNSTGQFTDERYSGKTLTPYTFGIWLGTLPATRNGEEKLDGYTITVKYTTQVNPELMANLHKREQGVNYVFLKQNSSENKDISQDITLQQAVSPYWVDYKEAQSSLAKSVGAYDPVKRIVTYNVDINPQVNIDAWKNAVYSLEDTLGQTGASYIADSFKLIFKGTVDPGTSEFTYDPSENTVLWSQKSVNTGENYTDLTYGQACYMISPVGTKLEIESSESKSDSFTFSFKNVDNLIRLTSSDADKNGKLPPMVLTYQVQLPDQTTSLKPNGNVSITNGVKLFRQEDGEKDAEQLNTAESEFDYNPVMYKSLDAEPTKDNGYVVSFGIDVSKDALSQGVAEFTVKDEMSKSLRVDPDSVKVYGINGNNKSEIIGCKVAYDDRDSTDTGTNNNVADGIEGSETIEPETAKNILKVTITAQGYDHYRIEYKANVQGEAKEIVQYDNVAEIEGTNIVSNKISQKVEIQEQDAHTDGKNFKIQLSKYDGSEVNQKLEATFALYVYDTDNKQWSLNPVWTGKTDKTTGTVEIANEGNNRFLARNKWYKLVETKAPQGYCKGTTYFYTGTLSEGGEKPEGVNGYQNVIFVETDTGDTQFVTGALRVANYKPTLEIKKVDKDNLSTCLAGAEFTLYKDEGCTEVIAIATSKESSTDGICTFDFSNREIKANTKYYMKETKAPKNYILDQNTYTVMFDGNGLAKVSYKDGQGNEIYLNSNNDHSIQFTNKSGYKLPEAGGKGFLSFTIGGTLLLALGLLYGFIMRRTRERRYNN